MHLSGNCTLSFGLLSTSKHIIIPPVIIKTQSIDEDPELLFHIVYEDGDEEDLDLSELQNLVTAQSVKAVRKQETKQK